MSNVTQVFLVITCADDSTCLMGFVTEERHPLKPGVVRWSRLATPQAVEATIAQSSLAWSPEKLPIKGWRFVNEKERALYEQRDFRNALRDIKGKVQHHMPTAREIHREHLRRARAPHLAAADVEYMRADEQDDAATKKKVAARKQTLRDLTDDPAIEAAKTVDDLRAAWPADLPRDV